jgi:hypothetical protein
MSRFTPFRLVVAGLVGVTVVLGAFAAPRADASRRAASASTAAAPGRVIVLSVPELTWAMVQTPQLAHLRAFLADSAVADLAPRVDRSTTAPGDGYATVGAGTRSYGPITSAGLAFAPSERYGTTTAGAEYERRTGHAAHGAIVVLGAPAAVKANDAGQYDGKPGLLGSALASAGVQAGVVGNADLFDPLVPADDYHREVAFSLMQRDGTVACGRVDRGLLTPDASSAYGVRLSVPAVVAAFDACSTPRSVVLVEASDLRRARAAHATASSAGARALDTRARQTTGELIDAVLARVDLARDAVVVVAPTVSSAHLTVFAVHAPGVRPGLLVSGNTRQAGYVMLSDTTPTIAALAGVKLETADLEGRPVTWARVGGSVDARFAGLVNADDAARFRDSLVGPVSVLYALSTLFLGAIATFVLVRHRRRAPWLEYAALCLLATIPLVYLAAPIPFREWGVGAYFAYLIGGSLLLGAGYFALRRRPLLPLLVGYGIAFLVTSVSVVVLHSKLQISTVFGDSPIVAGRFSGINNVTFGAFMIAAVALAAIAAHELRGRTRTVTIVGILVVALAIDAAPGWGSDVGGALSGVAGLACIAMLLNGWRVRIRTVVTWLIGTFVVVIAFGLFDLTRDASQQTHLGRLFQRIGADGFSGFWLVVHRKLDSNLGTIDTSAFRWLLLAMIVAAVAIKVRAPVQLRELGTRFPELLTLLPGLVLLAALGYALNDSGINTPGMMLAVAIPGVVYVLFRLTSEPLDQLGGEESRAATGPLVADEPVPAPDPVDVAS